jgi:hypothetical protein
MNHVILEYLSREAAYMRLAGKEQTDGTKMGWNNGANSNPLYRPEASRFLTGAPADIYHPSFWLLYSAYDGGKKLVLGPEVGLMWIQLTQTWTRCTSFAIGISVLYNLVLQFDLSYIKITSHQAQSKPCPKKHWIASSIQPKHQKISGYSSSIQARGRGLAQLDC